MDAISHHSRTQPAPLLLTVPTAPTPNSDNDQRSIINPLRLDTVKTPKITQKLSSPSARDFRIYFEALRLPPGENELTSVKRVQTAQPSQGAFWGLIRLYIAPLQVSSPILGA